MQLRAPIDLPDVELDGLLEEIFAEFGYDFREYSRPSLKRRIRRVMNSEGIRTISALRERLPADSKLMARFVEKSAVNVTAMFRDPAFFLTFRRRVVPLLRSYPSLRVWIAGCSTGEEAYSAAIVLAEERLLDRAEIFATDISPRVLEQAREGVFRSSDMREYTRNYLLAGGKEEFSSYYTANYGQAVFNSQLRSKLQFFEHNLATDSSFAEFQVILCRNVLIYFDKALQARVQRLFYDSLRLFGVLGLGRKESLRFTSLADCYEELEPSERLYKRIR